MPYIPDLVWREGADPAETLTPRDLEVALLTAQGLERDTVAERLELSRSAVNRHMRKAFDLTGAGNATALVALLMAHRLLNPRAIDPAAPDPDCVKGRALKILRQSLIKEPVDEVEEHVNGLLTAIHDQMDREL